MKTCVKCGNTHDTPRCMPCRRQYQRERVRDNPELREKNRKKSEEWRLANPERARERVVDWHQRNPERLKELNRARYESDKEKVNNQSKSWAKANPEKLYIIKKRWRHNNPHAVSAFGSNYRARKSGAKPAWADESEIFRFYEAREAIEKETGETWHVDHIVPLQSKIVCGLHCEFNLQLLPALENQRKGNFHWPDMPS